MTIFSRNFYSENYKWIRIILTLFALSVIFGIISALLYPELMADIIRGFEDEFGLEPSLNLDLAVAIFRQNFMVSVLAILGGLLIGIVPIIVVLANGFILGYVTTFIIFSTPEYFENLFLLILGLVPHGIIEIPIFLLSAVLGLRFGTEWMTENTQGRIQQVFADNASRILKHIPVILLGLIAAALIEVFISGKLID